MDEIDLKMYEEIMASKLFNDEEKEVFRTRFEKQKERNAIIDKLDRIDFSSNEFKLAMDEIIKIDGDYCEHNRSLMGTCSSCDELDKKTAQIYDSLFGNAELN